MLSEYEYFRRKVLSLTGIDLGLYKSDQVKRRLHSMMKRLNIDGFVAYARLLEKDPERLKEFRNWLTIHVSEFFRNPDKFQELEEAILPPLLKGKRGLNVWSAGAANGSEPYSIAIILKELAPFGNHRILATDIDKEVLEVAMEGIYEKRDLVNVSPKRLMAFFKPISGEGEFTLYRISPEIQKLVTFRQHNLLRDPYEEGFDLILCRNVIIYFTDKARDEIFRKFHASLNPGGVLFIGATESILNAREIGFEVISPFFYRKAS